LLKTAHDVELKKVKEIEKFKRKVKFLSPEEAANLVNCLFHCIIAELLVCASGAPYLRKSEKFW